MKHCDNNEILRYSETSHNRLSEIMFENLYENIPEIFIENSKTEIYRKGNWVYLDKRKYALRLVQHLKRYLKFVCNGPCFNLRIKNF